MKKIFFFARDPGGANSLVDIIKESQLIYDCDVYAKDFACTIFEKNNIDYKKVENIETVLVILHKYNLLFTGTSYFEYSEHSIWEKSFEIGLESIAYLDHWMGYERFYEKSKKKYVLPKTLIVTDNIAKEKVLNKFKNFNVFVEALGSTFLQKIYNNKLSSKRIKQLKVKKNLNRYDEIIIYAAEVIKGEIQEYKYGINEYTQFESLYNNLQNTNIKLFFLPHPKHNIENVNIELSNIIQKSYGVDVEIANKEDVIELADKIFGINTMVLVEALIYQIPSCSIQIGVKEVSDFELLRKNIIFNANTNDRLISFINHSIKPFKYNVKNIEHSLDNIMKLIAKKINNEKK